MVGWSICAAEILKADLTAPKSDFRFTPESGLKSDITPFPFSANSGSRVYFVWVRSFWTRGNLIRNVAPP
jgi:hypothetical protein